MSVTLLISVQCTKQILELTDHNRTQMTGTYQKGKERCSKTTSPVIPWRVLHLNLTRLALSFTLYHSKTSAYCVER